MKMSAPSDRTCVRRVPERACYDVASINAILDEGFVCHLAFVVEGQPFAMPTGYVRQGERLLVHGSSASRMVRTLATGVDVCLTVTLVDGLVLARSAFHHSVNYRSVVVLGKALPLTDPREKLEALELFTNHMVPGRWAEVRGPNEQELKATAVLALPLKEASAKVRKGPPNDLAEDLTLPVWAGVVPMTVRVHAPIAADGVPASVSVFDVGKLDR